MQSLFDNSSHEPTERLTVLEQLAAEEAKPKDAFRGVRVVLLIAAAIGLISLWFTTVALFWYLVPVVFLLILAWILSLVWPHSRT